MPLRLLAPFVLAALAGCAGPSGEDIQLSDQAASGQYRSFSVAPVRTPGHRLDLEQRFTQAVSKALVDKGYAPAEQGDLKVIYALGLEREAGVELKPVQVGGATYTQTLTREDDYARLALRILDARTQAVLYQANIGRHLNNPDLSQERFDQGVARLLEDFPARR